MAWLTSMRRVAMLFGGLVAANVAAWTWALLAFHDYPVLLGTALLAYGFGLRHAVDADHIAAIANVTRKLMQDGQRPVGVGLFFSLGHSTIVVLATVAIAATAVAFRGRLELLHGIGGGIGTLVSSLFLLAIAAMNVVILLTVRQAFRRACAGERVDQDELDLLLSGRGLLARIFRPLFHMIRASMTATPDTAPMLAVTRPYDGKPATVGNGSMVALIAESRETVGAVRAKALTLGGADEGPPGKRSDEPDDLYRAYFRDLDGNKLMVFTMAPS